jgi:hypothetical protein
MVSMGDRSDAPSDPLPLVYRATLAFAVGSLALVVLVLAAVVLFAWFVHFRWLPDWLVNLLGVVLALGIPFVVWRTMRFLSRRRYRFSLRSTMILTATLAVALSILGHQLRFAAREHRALQALWKDGSGAQYHLKSYEDSAWFCWLIKRFGHDPFARVTEVRVRTDVGVQTVLDHQAEFADLEVLKFGAGVTDQGLERVSEFNRFSNLQIVDFRQSPLTDAGIEQISHWTNLPALGLYGCNRVTDAGLAHLVDMPALEEMAFISEGGADTTLTDAGLAHVGRMHHLRTLFVHGLPITDAGLEHLRPLAGLRRLRIYRTKVTKQGIARLQQALPQCEILSDVN